MNIARVNIFEFKLQLQFKTLREDMQYLSSLTFWAQKPRMITKIQMGPENMGRHIRVPQQFGSQNGLI